MVACSVDLAPMSNRRMLAAVVAALTVIALGVGLSALPVQSWLLLLGERLQSFGLIGLIGFVAIYVVGSMVLIPASALSFAAGFLYGPFGIVLSWAAMLAVAAISFPLARHLVAHPVRRFVNERQRMRIVADVINDEGWRMVLLIRVSGFIPFGLQNYVLGVTEVPFVPYLAASSIGFLPSILVYAGSGAFGGAAVIGAGTGPLRLLLLGMAILAGSTLVILTGAKVRSRLSERSKAEV